MKISNLKGMLLLSSFEGDMRDDIGLPSLFSGSVVYIYADDECGVRGVALNKPFSPGANVMFSGLDIALDEHQESKFNSELSLGGSSRISRVSVVYTDASDGSVQFSTAKKIVKACILGGHSLNNRFLIGESSWGEGEIYSEIAKGWWHIVPPGPYIIFGGDADLMHYRAIQSINPRPGGIIMAPFHGRA